MSRFMYVAVALLMLGSTNAEAGIIGPIQWKKSDGGNDHYYELLYPTGGGVITWSDARLAASQSNFMSVSGHLVTVADQAEDDFLEANFQSEIQASGGYAWIGLTDEITEGNFEWITGEALTYTNWLPGEPNNLSGIEHYVQYFAGDPGGNSTWGWNDNGNDGGRPIMGYIVEYDIPGVPEPSAIITWSLMGLFCLSCRYRRRLAS